MSLGENRSVSLVGEIGPFLGSEFERFWGLNGNVSGEGELVCLGGGGNISGASPSAPPQIKHVCIEEAMCRPAGSC